MTDPDIPIDRIDRWITSRCWIQAYRAVLLGLEARPGDGALLAAGGRLAQALWSRGMELGTNKATEMSDAVFEVEAMRDLVIRLNRKGIHGVAPDGG